MPPKGHHHESCSNSRGRDTPTGPAAGPGADRRRAHPCIVTPPTAVVRGHQSRVGRDDLPGHPRRLTRPPRHVRVVASNHHSDKLQERPMSAFGPVATTRRPRAARIARPPVVWASVGFAVYVLAMVVGEVFDLNADDHTRAAPHDGPVQALHLPEIVIGLLAAAIVVLAASRALSGPPASTDRWALGLATLAAASIPIFWAGWPTIVGAVTIGLALTQPRRLGSVSRLSVAAIGYGSATWPHETRSSS